MNALRVQTLARRTTGLARRGVSWTGLPLRLRRVFIRIALTTPNGSRLTPDYVESVRRLLVRSPDSETAILAARVLAEQRRAGLPAIQVVEIASSMFTTSTLPPACRAAGSRRLIDELAYDGDLVLTGHLCKRLSANVPEREADSLRFHVACRNLDLGAANAAIAALGQDTSGTSEYATRIVSFGDATAIATAPQGVRPAQARRALLDIGQLGAAAELTKPADLASRVEMLILCGDIAAAQTVIERHLDVVAHDLGFLRTAHFVARSVNPELVEALRTVATAGSVGLSQRVRSLAELARPEEAIECAGSHPLRHLDAHGIHSLAQAHYALRDFAAVGPLLAQLAGSVRHAEANKLAARVLLEQGRFVEALQNRTRHGVPSRELDEVVHHSLLGLGRRHEAFAAYCPLGARLDGHMTFPNQRPSANNERRPLRPNDDVFVIAQSGPGDEIQMAMAYAALAATTRSVTCSGDPRLHDLFARSFQSISFVPTTRRSQSLHWGFLANDQPSRHASNLASLLDFEAGQIAARADRIVFARELPGLLGLTERSPQSVPYLRPAPDTRSANSTKFEDRGPAVGIVWRSELSSMMRSIHYLDLAHLESMFDTHLNFVCLQHDASESERNWLTHRLGRRISFVSGVDLGDDLDAAASLISSLDAVVGVGTTLVELAGALGVPTVILQPNHFGTWRSVDAGCHDFWYQNVRVAAQPGEADRSRLSAHAVTLLASLGVR